MWRGCAAACGRASHMQADSGLLREAATMADITAADRPHDLAELPTDRAMKLSSHKQRLPGWAAFAAVAVASAGLAAWVEHESRKAERRHPAPGRFIHIDGVRLHYRIEGEGEAVLLVHGNMVAGSDFEASGLLERLARDHRVLVIDRPGYGHSDRTRGRSWTPAEQARLLFRAAVALGFDRFAVVGHSLGTQVAIAMALGHPANVNRLVLVSGYYFPSLRPDAVA